MIQINEKVYNDDINKKNSIDEIITHQVKKRVDEEKKEAHNKYRIKNKIF